jgi:uncharacterized membrane protein
MPTDLLFSLALTIAAVGAAVAPVPAVVSVVFGVPFLFFVPGYTVTVALFPRGLPWKTDIEAAEGLLPFDRVVLSVALSLALAVIVGVNLEVTMWPIQATTVVGGLAVVTLVAASIGALRRSRLEPGYTLGTDRNRGSTVSSTATGSNLATLMVVLAVVVSLVSVAVVAGTDQRGESYTEMGLLTENDDGELVASGHPSELAVDEPTTLYYTLRNREQQTMSYSLVVRLEAVGQDGSVTRADRLTSFDEELAAGERIQREHSVSPTFQGEDLRLRYLLYTGEPPAEPTGEEAYRQMHLWVDVTASGNTTAGS